MPFEYEVAFSPPMAQLTVHGSPGPSEWRVALRRLVEDPALPPGAAVLCDLRAATADGERAPISEDLLDLLGHRRAALVVRAGERPALEREASAASHLHVEIFTDYRTALRWLLDGSDESGDPESAH